MLDVFTLVVSATCGFWFGKSLHGHTCEGFAGMGLAIIAFIVVGTSLFYRFGGQTEHAATLSSWITVGLIFVVGYGIKKKFHNPWHYYKPKATEEAS